MSAIARLLEAAPRYAKLLSSQYWPQERLASYREQHLEQTLSAARRIPFYAERMGGNVLSADLSRLPILHRADVEALNQSVRTLFPAGTRFVHSRSSATSGSAVNFIFDRSHQNGRHAARARFLRAHRWNPFERTAWLVGQVLLESPYDRFNHDLGFISRVFAGVRFIPNWLDFREHITRLAEMRPRYLYLFPSILDGILRILEERQQNLPSLRKIFTGAEVLDDSLRERARRQLGVEIADNYGAPKRSSRGNAPTVAIT